MTETGTKGLGTKLSETIATEMRGKKSARHIRTMNETCDLNRMETMAYQDHYKKLMAKRVLYSTPKPNGEGLKRHRGVITALETRILSNELKDWTGNVIVKDEKDGSLSIVSYEDIRPAPIKGLTTVAR